MSYAEFRSASVTSPQLGSPSGQRTTDHSTREIPETQAPQATQSTQAVPPYVDDPTLNDMLVAPGREQIPKLSPSNEPSTYWFRVRRRNDICKTILSCFHNLLTFPYPSYAKIPAETKRIWFRSFAQHWNWDPAISGQVQAAFDEQTTTQYSSHMTEWKKRWKLNKPKPNGLNNDVWTGLIAYWRRESTVAIAETNSQNRLSERGGKGPAIHNSGVKTKEQREIEMTKENGGVRPNLLDLMEDMYTNKSTGEIQDSVARELLETLKKLKADKETQLQQAQLSTPNDDSIASNMLSCEDVNQIVLENIPVKKRRRFGVSRIDEGHSSTQCNISDPRITSEMEKIIDARISEERARMQEEFGPFRDFMARVQSGEYSIIPRSTN